MGLEPVGDNLIVDPALPQSIGLLALLDIPGRWGRVDATELTSLGFGDFEMRLSTRPDATPQ